MGSYDTLRPSLLEKLVIEDKNQVKASVEKIFNWDFQRVNTETCACRLTVGALPRSLWLMVALWNIMLKRNLKKVMIGFGNNNHY